MLGRLPLPVGRRRSLALAVAALLSLSACTIGSPPDATIGAGLGASVSVTDPGLSAASEVAWTERPRYHVSADIDPRSGEVDGHLRALLPVASGVDELELLFLPIAIGATHGSSVSEVTVDGGPVTADVDAYLGTVTLPVAAVAEPGAVALELDFQYEVENVELEPPSSFDPTEPTTNEAPSGVSVLSLIDDGVVLGGWFPMVARSGDDDAVITAVPASELSVELQVPEGYDVVSGGIRTATESRGETTVIREQHVGPRTPALLVVEGRTAVSRTVGQTTVRVWATDDEQSAQQRLADDAAAALETLNGLFGPYPWRELEIATSALGGDTGGVSWSGVTWLDPTLVTTDDALGREMLRWGLAHELAHQWWGALVSSDGLLDPAQDEALAQYSACLVQRGLWPDPERVCEDQITFLYRAVRSLGFPDTVVDKNLFAFPEQELGMVYGKGPHALLSLEERYGEDELVAALRAYAEDRPFGVSAEHDLVAALGSALGDAEAVEDLWHRWMREIHGDEDLDYVEGELSLDFG